MAIQRWGSRPTALCVPTVLMLVLVSVACIQPSEGFEVVRRGRLCQTSVGTTSYFPSYTVDASDLERFTNLQRLTDPSIDPFQIDMNEFSKLLNQFRSRMDTKCAEAYFPLPGATNEKPVSVGGKSSGAVRAALDDCMCKRTRDWLLQRIVGIYTCDWPATRQVDLWRLVKRKVNRFNRFVRFQLAVNGDVSAVEMYDALVDGCVYAYVDEHIGKASAFEGITGNEDAVKSKPVTSTPSPSPKTPKPPTTPTTKKPKAPKTTASASEPAAAPVGSSGREASGRTESPSPAGSTARVEECETARAACLTNVQLASEFGHLAQRMSALSLAVILLVVVVIAAVVTVVVAIGLRTWRRQGRSEEYRPLVPVAPLLDLSE